MKLYSLLLFILLLLIFTILLFDISGKTKLLVNKEVDFTFLNTNKKASLLYFGYVGCDTVCTQRFAEVQSVYMQIKNIEKDNLDVVFLNMKENRDKEQANLFAKHYHQDFRGINLSKNDLKNLPSDLNLYYSDKIFDKTAMNHTSFLYFICKNDNSYILKSIYMELKKEDLLKDLRECIGVKNDR